MRKELYKLDYPTGKDLRIIKNLIKVNVTKDFPEGLEFSIQLLKNVEGSWMQIARIDNQFHLGKPGTHIHYYERVTWQEMTFNEAEEKIDEIAERVKNHENRDC